uniref:stomatin-like protein 2, mitochondrial n=1 Tax=Scatophagus argus TaxID=75038 RepID=UPI001ED81230|nr:stomatin-like protein 2, mitochondrial [Scatophagus argus]
MVQSIDQAISSFPVSVEAEQRKGATAQEYEGIQEAAISIAEGRKEAQILTAEGEEELFGEAQAVLAKAEAKSKAVRLLSEALAEQNGSAAAPLNVAEEFAKESNTGDISGMIRPRLFTARWPKGRPKVESIKTKTEEPS